MPGPGCLDRGCLRGEVPAGLPAAAHGVGAGWGTAASQTETPQCHLHDQELPNWPRIKVTGAPCSAPPPPRAPRGVCAGGWEKPSTPGLTSALHPGLIHHQPHLRPSGTLSPTRFLPPLHHPQGQAFSSPEPPSSPAFMLRPSPHPAAKGTTPTHKLYPSIHPQILPSQKAPCVAGSTQPLSRTSYPRAPLQQGCPGPHLDTQLGTGQTHGHSLVHWENGRTT